MLLGFGRGSPTIFEGTKEQKPQLAEMHIFASAVFKVVNRVLTDL